MNKETVRFLPHVDLLFATCCTSLSVKEATTRMNAEVPTGTKSKWVLAKKKELPKAIKKNPWPCDDNPKWKHMYFIC